MIAMLTPGGAFIYDMTENQADEFAVGKGLSCCEASKSIKAWVLHGTELPMMISNLGVFICYVSLEDMDGEAMRDEYLKISTSELANAWGKVFIKNKHLRRKEHESS